MPSKHPHHPRHHLLRFLLLLSPILLCSNGVTGTEYRISDTEGFKDFVNNVNSGTSYSGTTVLLDSDLSPLEINEPIGSSSSYFSGTFDGQGHIISDLTINLPPSIYTGLFGYSTGLTIRNVVLDSSCSISSSYSSFSPVYAGGIIGECYASDSRCNIENSVNMASVTFSGYINYYLYIGGIAGHLYSKSSNSNVYMRNCANYGSITHSGDSCGTYVGGLVGDISGNTYGFISNCLNYGSITHSGTLVEDLYLGGIIGNNNYTHIENSVSVGEVFTQNTPSNSYIGSIAGGVNSGTHINYCYYANELDGYSLYGTGTPTSVSYTYTYNKITIELDGTVSFGEHTADSLIAALNAYTDYYTPRNYSKWLHNKNNDVVKFIINSRVYPITMKYQVILLPSLVGEGNMTFYGWYSDEALSSPFTDSEVETSTTLYGSFRPPITYTVTLDVNGGNELSEGENETSVEQNGNYGELPTPERTGYSFAGWFTKSEGGEKIEVGDKVTNSNNHTLYAQWNVNNYTVTFDINGGNELAKKELVVTFNSPYSDLPEAVKEGYAFLGWFIDNNKSVTKESIVSIASNHTLQAHWEKITNQVEVVFSTKDLSREDVEKIVKKYVDEDTKFTIVNICADEAGETKVIIKFFEAERAEEFVRNVNELGRDVNKIKRIGFVSYADGSFSLLLYPITFMIVLL